VKKVFPQFDGEKFPIAWWYPRKVMS
jgi:hypothetical protein